MQGGGERVKAVEREERLVAACLLSAAGGFTDVYSYLFRGGVFANAVTGNLVILGLRLATGDVRGAAHGVCAVLAYGMGVMFANVIHGRYGHARRFGWHQVVLWVEAALLAMYIDRELTNNSRVARIKLGYSKLTEVRGSTILLPTWLVWVENKTTKNITLKRVNAYTAQMLQSSTYNVER